MKHTQPERSHRTRTTRRERTYSDQDAVQVPGLVAVAVLGVLPQQLRQPPHAGHPQDVDVVVATESLQQREVDLQGDVVLVLLVRGKDAEDHAVRISARNKTKQESQSRRLHRTLTSKKQKKDDGNIDPMC